VRDRMLENTIKCPLMCAGKLSGCFHKREILMPR
jgi:hypothetical protein